MISFRRALLATFLTTSLVLAHVQSVFAEAPVVDDSENFELFEQQASHSAPATSHHTQEYDNIDTPLAHEESRDDSMGKISNNTALLNKLQGMQQEIQELRGQLEVQAHELKLLKQQQVDFYKDLDTRVRSETSAQQKKTIEPSTLSKDLDTNITSPQTKPLTQPLSQTPPLTQNEKSSYLEAYALINNKQFDEALPAMETFIANYPQSGYAANAHYWVGELYMVQKKYPDAIQHFETVLQKFPSSSKSSASLLKIGYALAASGEINQAKQKLQRVIEQYPDTHAAQLAMAKLDSLGHP